MKRRVAIIKKHNEFFNNNESYCLVGEDRAI